MTGHYEVNGYNFERYTTKFTIEFADSMTVQEGVQYLDQLGFPYNEIWEKTYVVTTGCGVSAEQFYTNYGTSQKISLGDSSFVKYVNPVYYNHHFDSDFRLTGKVGVQFIKDLEYKRIETIVNSLHLQFRDYDPGAYSNTYWLIVPKQACCNPIKMSKILQTYQEVEVASPAFNNTMPAPSTSNKQ